MRCNGMETLIFPFCHKREECGQAVIRLQAYNWYKLQFSNGLLVITFWSSRNVSKLVPLSGDHGAIALMRALVTRGRGFDSRVVK